MVDQAEIHEMAQSEYEIEREEAIRQLCYHFAILPNKKQGWYDLIQLLKRDEQNDPGDCDEILYLSAAKALGTAFSYIADKKQAWMDLHKLANGKKCYMRMYAAIAIGIAFFYIPNKKQAWSDLHKLTRDNYCTYGSIELHVVKAIDLAFPYLPDKKQAYENLILLTKCKHNLVRLYAAKTLGTVFTFIPEDKQVWEYIARLANDTDKYLRIGAADALGLAFPHVENKQQAWGILYQLTLDKEGFVRASANYSLGRAYIFNATMAQNEDSFRKELEKALEFFEKSYNEESYLLSIKFCFPFYRSFYAIIFDKENAEAEVFKYLAEAKSVVEGSEIKEKLLEAIENLANALNEAQKLHEIDVDFNNVKCDLNTYKRYWERAAKLLEITEEKAPGATMVLKRGLPIIDKKIKELLKEIEEKTKKFCKESRRTPFEKISRSAYNSVKGLGGIDNPIVAVIRLERLVLILRNMCDILPEGSREVVYSQLDEIKEAELPDRALIVESALNFILAQQKSLIEKLAEKDKLIEYLESAVLSRLNNISCDISELKIRSGEIVPSLWDIQNELNKLKAIETKLNYFESSLTEFGNLAHHDNQRLNDEISRLIIEIETKVIPILPQTSATHAILDKLNNLQQSEKETWFNRVAGLSSIVGLLLTILSTST